MTVNGGNGAAVSPSDGPGDAFSTEADLPPALVVTARQAFELARLLDRAGDGIVASFDGVLSVLVDTAGAGQPDLAFDLDPDGCLLGHRALTVYREEEEPDGLDDLSPEEATVEGVPVVEALREGARLAKRCSCPQPWPDSDGTCARCGHALPYHGVAA